MSKDYAELVDFATPIGHYIERARAVVGDDINFLRIDLIPGKAKSWQIYASDDKKAQLTPPAT